MSGPVAAQTSTIQAAFVAENGMQLVEYATPEETVAAVKNGEAVAVLADKDYLAPDRCGIGRRAGAAGEVKSPSVAALASASATATTICAASSTRQSSR